MVFMKVLKNIFEINKDRLSDDGLFLYFDEYKKKCLRALITYLYDVLKEE